MKTYPGLCGDKCRSLTSGERSLIHGVFKTALTLDAIRIHDHAHPDKGWQRDKDGKMVPPDKPIENAHTDGNDILMPDVAGADCGSLYWPDYSTAPIYFQAKLIHELAHVWQNQSGTVGAYPHNRAMEVIRAAHKLGEEASLSDVADAHHRAENWHQRNPGKRQTHDAIGSRWGTNPVVQPETKDQFLPFRQMDGSWSAKILKDREKEVRLSQQYAAQHNMSEAAVRERWQKYADYDYLTPPIDQRDSEKVFDGLNLEEQAQMIEDYFLLTKGVDPASPQACIPGSDRKTIPYIGKPRPDIGVYKSIIPFLRGQL